MKKLVTEDVKEFLKKNAEKFTYKELSDQIQEKFNKKIHFMTIGDHVRNMRTTRKPRQSNIKKTHVEVVKPDTNNLQTEKKASPRIIDHSDFAKMQKNMTYLEKKLDLLIERTSVLDQLKQITQVLNKLTHDSKAVELLLGLSIGANLTTSGLLRANKEPESEFTPNDQPINRDKNPILTHHRMNSHSERYRRTY